MACKLTSVTGHLSETSASDLRARVVNEGALKGNNGLESAGMNISKTDKNGNTLDEREDPKLGMYER